MRAYRRYGDFSPMWHTKDWIDKNIKSINNQNFQTLAIEQSKYGVIHKEVGYKAYDTIYWDEIEVNRAVYLYGGRTALVDALENWRGSYLTTPVDSDAKLVVYRGLVNASKKKKQIIVIASIDVDEKTHMGKALNAGGTASDSLGNKIAKSELMLYICRLVN